MLNMLCLSFRAWRVPAFGHEIGNTLCDIIRKNGGMDLLIDNCIAQHKALQFNSAKLLQQCLITENRSEITHKDENYCEIICLKV